MAVCQSYIEKRYCFLSPIVIRESKILYNFGLSERKRVKEIIYDFSM